MGDSFNTTSIDAAKNMQKSAKRQGGEVAADSYASGQQSVVGQSGEQQSKANIIEERKSGLPMPEQPPVASDFKTNDASTQNVGSGGRSDDFSAGGEASDGLRGPATGASAVRDQGAQLKENTAGMNVGRTPGGVPADAAAGRKTDTVETRQPDFGYPHQSDPTKTEETRAPKETKLAGASEGPGA